MFLINSDLSSFSIINSLVWVGIYGIVGRKLQANAEEDSQNPVDPPKVEEKLGAVPHGLSTDSDVAKRLDFFFFNFLCYFSCNMCKDFEI